MLPLANHLRRRDHGVSLVDLPHSLSGRLRLLQAATQHDVVVLQKKLFPAAFVSLLRLANPKLIFDVDDAVMFHELERGQPVTGRFFQRFVAIAAASRIVVAGNAYVADFARAARGKGGDGVVVLPTPIDTQYLSAKSCYAQKETVVVGWIGTKGNLHQLTLLATAFREVQKEVPSFRLRIVADAALDMSGVNSEFKPWRATEEIQDLHGFDIGIMPLADSLWNRGKGGYKLLQYMAAGLPAVASPVGINKDIVRSGENGFLAANEGGWRESLLGLAKNPELRQRIGQAARATIETGYALEGYLERYAKTIEGCLA